MRYRVYKNDGLGLSNYSSKGGNLVGFLLLSETASSAEYAIRKDRTDMTFQSLTSSAITSGYLQGATFTSLISGDLEALSTTTVRLSHRTPQGEYAKVSVNAKGLVDANYSLSSDDIPSLDWSKITTGKPVTAGGYGITDALLNTGGTVTGNITLSSLEPVAWDYAATKYYVDTQLTIFSAPYIKTGDIVIRSSHTGYPGYLRCNGGILSKTTYADLYSALGDSFSYDTDNFKLPDLTTSEPTGFAFFIRSLAESPVL